MWFVHLQLDHLVSLLAVWWTFKAQTWDYEFQICPPVVSSSCIFLPHKESAPKPSYTLFHQRIVWSPDSEDHPLSTCETFSLLNFGLSRKGFSIMRLSCAVYY